MAFITRLPSMVWSLIFGYLIRLVSTLAAMFKHGRTFHTPAATAAAKSRGRSPAAPHVSPFTTSPTDPLAVSPTPSDLPDGVCYIRQTPNSIYRPVTHRSATVVKKRDPSPGKSLRFAEPLVSATRRQDPTRAKSSERIDRPCRSRQHLNRPLIKPTDTPDGGNDCAHKTVVKSPATSQTSPIFASSNVFGGDCNASAVKPLNNCVRSKSVSRESTPDSGPSASPPEPKTLVKTAINVPNKTVHKSSVLTPTDGSHIHRKTLTIPLQTLDRKGDPNRLSVNVNVAVGLQCDDEKVRHSLAKKAFEQQMGHHMISSMSDDSGSDTSSVVRHETSDEVDYNVAQSVSGSAIQVAVRLRPFLKNDRSDEPVVEMSGNTVRIINSDNDKYNRLEFGFDYTLNSSDRDLFDFADQDKVFVEMGRPLLERAIEGYNVCMFAYGQTGSGKSFTMTGTESNLGVIPRFVRELFKRIQTLYDIVFSVDVSYCEIYNEKIYDLLSDDKLINKKTLRIREHPQSGPYVEHLSQHSVTTYNEAIELLSKGTRRRATASTAANEQSSRSHSIFTIVLSQLRNTGEIEGLDHDVSSCCGSRINLIDLAGSERVGISGTSGERLKEGSLINTSLLNLGKVITKLSQLGRNRHKVAHIPYRDSILTYLLKDSLGGNSRTSMIATISPAKCHLEETLSTLRYAARAREIVNYVHINEDPKNRRIRELMEEIEFLKSQRAKGELVPHVTLRHKPCDDSVESVERVEPKVIPTFSIGTNTSFVESRRMSTKGTETSVTRTQTCSIATNTSFVKLPKTCSTGTETLTPAVSPKPVLKNTGTEMSFSEMSSKTTFIDLPTREDLWKSNKLEEKQKKLLEEIRKYKEKLLSNGGNGSGSNGSAGNGSSGSSSGGSYDRRELKTAIGGEESEYFDCENEVQIKTEPKNISLERGEDEVDNEWTDDNAHNDYKTNGEQNDGNWDTGVTEDQKETEGTNEWATDANKDANEWAAEDKKNEDNNDNNEWATDGNNDDNTATNEWGAEDNNEENNENNDWENEGTSSADNKDANEWGTDTKESADNADTNEWGTDDKKDTNDNTNEWGTDDKETKESNEWADNGNEDTNWASEENKDTEEWGDNGNSGNVATNDDNKGTDEWGTDDKGNEDAEEWGDDNDNSNWDNDNTVVTKEDKKDNEEPDWDNQW